MLSARSATSLLTRSRSISNAAGGYDYVIVGAGSAGAVVAHRLVKDAGAKVLLIENGSSHQGRWDWWKINMPAALTFNLANAKYNWDFYTVPQRHMDGRRLHQPRGRALGGSSSLNAMAYVRGHALDYERWAEEIGEGGHAWAYRSILPYYRKAQTHQEGESSYRGGSGPLSVTRRRTPAVAAINDAFIAAGEQAGYPRTEDMNGFQQEGFGQMDMTVTPDGKRASTWECYLRPLMYPKNSEDEAAGKRLKVITNQMAVRLICEGTKVVGVETIPSPKPKRGGGFHSDSSGVVQRHFAREEVILSAGAVGSPQLLMTSGIGDAKELERLGLPVLLDQPAVGQNLQDHLEFYVQYLSRYPCSLYPWAATFPGLGGWLHQITAWDALTVAQCEDRIDMRAGLRLTVELMEQSALSDFKLRRYAPADLDLDSDEAVDSWIRSSSHSGYHLSCTCAMGKVVDATGRVNGLEKLRIVDASIMPSMTSGNLNAPTIMMAEKIADDICGRDALPPAEDASWYVPSDYESLQR
eukprot:s4739_g3.t4